MSSQQTNRDLVAVRFLLGIVIAGLVVSGVTAFPLPGEVALLVRWAGPGTPIGDHFPDLAAWLSRVDRGLASTDETFPFLFYGTDWLAFAHLVIAIAFIGPMRDPVKNQWVIQFGMIACALVPVLALVAGPTRGIPFFWRMIDCSFGVFGFIPLFLADRRVRALENAGGGSSRETE
jgi:hypothetical protein